jgi:hypothetical protein
MVFVCYFSSSRLLENVVLCLPRVAFVSLCIRTLGVVLLTSYHMHQIQGELEQLISTDSEHFLRSHKVVDVKGAFAAVTSAVV